MDLGMDVSYLYDSLKRDRMPIHDFVTLFGGGIASTIRGAMDSLHVCS